MSLCARMTYARQGRACVISLDGPRQRRRGHAGRGLPVAYGGEGGTRGRRRGAGDTRDMAKAELPGAGPDPPARARRLAGGRHERCGCHAIAIKYVFQVKSCES